MYDCTASACCVSFPSRQPYASVILPPSSRVGAFPRSAKQACSKSLSQTRFPSMTDHPLYFRLGSLLGSSDSSSPSIPCAPENCTNRPCSRASAMTSARDRRCCSSQHLLAKFKSSLRNAAAASSFRDSSRRLTSIVTMAGNTLGSSFWRWAAAVTLAHMPLFVVSPFFSLVSLLSSATPFEGVVGQHGAAGVVCSCGSGCRLSASAVASHP